MNNSEKNIPLVSILIPCYNEELFIEKCVNSIANNDFPKDKMEVFLIDGGSKDRTLEIGNQLEGKYPFVRILKNEKKIFPAAINLGYENSKGDAIIILGAHAEYSTNYISDNIKALYEYKVDNIGGLVEQIWPVKNFTGDAITIVLSSKFGIGGATYRTGTDKPTFVTTVFGGCYRRDVFERIGLFNEKLVSSSDMDFNTRLKKIGGKTLLIPNVKVFYHYAETNYKKFIKNNFRNGYWSVNPIKYLDYIPVSLRHLIPLFFVSGIFGAAVLSFTSIYFLWILTAAFGIYLLAAFYFASKYINKGLKYFLALPFFFFSLHFSYGLGSLKALVEVVFYKLAHIFKKG